MKTIWQSFLLIISFGLVYLWQQTPLSSYTIPTLGFLVFLYLLISARKKGKGFLTMGGEGPWGIFILNTVILLLIFSTGGLSSALFFLLYFLGFGIAFVFRPGVVFVYAIGVCLIFFQPALREDVMGNLIRLSSLLIISPLAFFFGREYRREEKQDSHLEAIEERTKDAADNISNDVEEVIKNEKETLKPDDVEKLNDILEETETLREETKK